ncbi:phytoene desaturase family protein [Azonexus sp.]|uniref:phytoene desaturase family protein n=1 Tax=Azonexus sp. TaxID=1872668 RepID=UPI0035B1CAD6
MMKQYSGNLQPCEVAVIGAGVGGLSTAIRLARLGLSVTVFERLERVGGLCGTVALNGRRYVVGCNDFGHGLRRDLKALGISLPFEHKKARIHFAGKHYSMPPDLQTILNFARRLPSFARYVLGLRQARRSAYAKVRFLDELVDEAGVSGRFADILMLPAYLMGVPPDRFRVDSILDEFSFHYGYANPTTPVGGPQALADALYQRLLALGGKVVLGCEVTGVEAVDGKKLIHTSQGSHAVDLLVSTLLKPGYFPPAFESGLPLSMLWLDIDSAYRLPSGIHTHLYYPPGIRQWFGDIYAGRMPAEFGFHFFCSDLGVQDGVNTASVYCHLPRGLAEDAAIQTAAQAYILDRIESLLPGIGGYLRACTMISPAMFREMHGMDPVLTPVIAPAGFPQPDNHAPEDDIYYAGAAAFPPGMHAGAAIRSSAYVSDLIARRLAEGR